MRKVYISLLLVISSLSFGQRTITISTDNVVQTMDGFGGSDAWRTQFVGKNWPEQKKNAIADLLFSKEMDPQGNPKGIGLSIWRFNLGAGSTEQGENSKVSDEWRRSECFLNADGSYDFSKQEGQRWFLQAEGTPATNQEIYDLTKSLSDKLRANKMNTEIVIAEAAQINYLYENVNGEDRDNQIDYFFGKNKTNISKLPNVKNVILGHSYFTTWPVDKQVLSRKLIAAEVKQKPGLKYWQSEYCILENPGQTEIPGGSGGGRDLGIQTALFVARLIHNDIAVANAASWQWWTSLTRVDYKDGLIYLDDGKSNGGTSPEYVKHDGQFHDSKLLWALGNYSLFVRPGMLRMRFPIRMKPLPRMM
jgi:hypothetical protein